MISIKHLFEDLREDSVPKKYKKRASKKCNVFKGFEESLPNLEYPSENTARFKQDLAEVRRCVRNPSLGKKFLDISDQKSEDIFKKYLKDEEVDWSKLDKILDEFDGVITRLKLKYNRPRPAYYFKEMGESIETKSAHSSSFPSGHTAFAYIICDYFSNMFPERSRELQKIAELIGQSRIENGVHFPSDVSAGRFIGEQAAQHILRKKPIQENINNKSRHKSFVKFLRKRAIDLRSSFKKKAALDHYTNDMAVFLSESTKINFNECYEASKNFISGYYLSNCTEYSELRHMLEGMCQVFYESQKDVSDLILLNKILEGTSSIRKEEKSTITGRMYASPRLIKEYLTNIGKFNNKPFLKMAALNWVAPFKSGNEKITNIIFLKETNFNFDITNQIITNDLQVLLENFYSKNNMGKILT